MTSDDAARAWVDAWTRGWRAHDPEPIARRYAPSATYRSHPFREPERSAREYASRVFAGEEPTPDVRFGAPVVDGERAAVEWWTVVRSDREEQTLAGVTMLRFDGDGLVVDHCDYWVAEAGARSPFAAWGT